MLIPVVLSGGAGTRLWPVSREGHPKPFMKVADGESLLLKTYLRAAGVTLANERGSEILTVTNRDYFFMSKDELARAQLGERQTGVFLLEPVGRNTAPAVALAARVAENQPAADEAAGQAERQRTCGLMNDANDLLFSSFWHLVCPRACSL